MFGLSNEIIAEINGIFAQYPTVYEAILFSSRAKGNYRTGSDIDLALKGNGITFQQLTEINLKIDDLGLLYKVDVLNYHEKAGTPLGDHIDRVGKVFYRKRLPES